MKSGRPGSWLAVLIAITVGMASMPVHVDAQQRNELKSWRRTLVHTARPARQGCFTAGYPARNWTQTDCVVPPNIPFRPHHGGPTQRETVGSGTDYAVQITGTASSMEGSFVSVSGVTSETGAGVSNAYTLQLNSEFFTTTTCTGGQSNCLGWEQFVFLNLETSTQSIAFIQYWLINYGATCPSGWTTDGQDCYRNSVYGAVVPVQTIATLGEMTLTGTAPSSTVEDLITLSIGNKLYSVSGNGYLPDLAQQWNTGEFNIFGPGNGSQAVFNSGASIVVQTAADSPNAAVSCVETGFTAETNNLSLTQLSSAVQDASWPSVAFMQSTAGGATANCIALPLPTGSGETDAPLPLWAIVGLGAALALVGSRRLRLG